MYHYKKIISRLLDQNIYILSNDKQESIIIDPGLGFELIDNYLKSFKTLFKSEYHLKLWGFMKDTFNDEFVEIVDGIINENN